jgi:hypothetical protein
MLQLLIVVGRALALGLRGHRELVLENLALRQLMAMKRTNNRPRLQARDLSLLNIPNVLWSGELRARGTAQGRRPLRAAPELPPLGPQGHARLTLQV